MNQPIDKKNRQAVVDALNAAQVGDIVVVQDYNDLEYILKTEYGEYYWSEDHRCFYHAGNFLFTISEKDLIKIEEYKVGLNPDFITPLGYKIWAGEYFVGVQTPSGNLALRRHTRTYMPSIIPFGNATLTKGYNYSENSEEAEIFHQEVIDTGRYYNTPLKEGYEPFLEYLLQNGNIKLIPEENRWEYKTPGIQRWAD